MDLRGHVRGLAHGGFSCVRGLRLVLNKSLSTHDAETTLTSSKTHLQPEHASF